MIVVSCDIIIQSLCRHTGCRKCMDGWIEIYESVDTFFIGVKIKMQYQDYYARWRCQRESYSSHATKTLKENVKVVSLIFATATLIKTVNYDLNSLKSDLRFPGGLYSPINLVAYVVSPVHCTFLHEAD